jgi:hypothetical protein
MSDRSERGGLILQLRSGDTLGLVITTDDPAVVDAAVRALEARLGVKTRPPLRILKPAEAPDEST